MDINYIEGFVRVPLSQFVSEDDRDAATRIHISGFEGILQNPKHRLTGHTDQGIQTKLLNILKITAGEFKSTTSSATIPSIAGQDICCMVNGGVLQAAKKLHGLDDSFECIVQICCLPPPQSKKLSDGDIFQNVRYFAKQRRYDIAQQWVNTLSAPKRRHLNFMFDRPVIMDSLDQLLCYPGLWAGLQLGNWAKHLAAHVDEFIVNYLGYISSSYERIFSGHEDLKHLLDESTVDQLQNLAPAWCKNDRFYIQEAFRQRTVFKYINSEEILTRLEQNLLSFIGIIPSIQSFHQNMKYLTIGVKILEKYIEVKPPAVKRGDITRTKPSLVANLSRDWVAAKAERSFQIDHEKFVNGDKPTAQFSFAQLLIAALRYFPLLSMEAPLQDFRGEWEAPLVSDDYIKLLCQTASQLGFDNEKIRKYAGSVPIIHRQYIKPFARRRWRSGKPPFHSFALLFNQSFTPGLFGKQFKSSVVPSPLCIQSAILRAFFNENSQLKVPDDTLEVQDLDTDMDDVKEVDQPEITLDFQKMIARQMTRPRQQTKTRLTLGPKNINKKGKQKSGNRGQITQLGETDPMDEDKEADEEMNQLTQESHPQQDEAEEPPLPDTTTPRIRPLEADDTDRDGGSENNGVDVNNAVSKKSKLLPSKKIPVAKRSKVDQENYVFRPTINDFKFGPTVDKFKNRMPAEEPGTPLNHRHRQTNTFEGIPQPSFGHNPTEAPASPKQITQAQINTEDSSQGTNRPASEPVVSREGGQINTDNPTEAPASPKQITQAQINTEDSSQGTNRPAAEPVVSREGSPEFPQVNANRIIRALLNEDEGEIT